MVGGEDRLPYATGLFSVTKDLERDRLILDCRPANVLEDAPNMWTSTLASPASLLQVILHASEVLQANTADLRDFFYLFSVSGSRLQRNLLKGTLTLAEAEQVFCHSCRSYADAKGRVRVSLATLAMGDTCACEFAQGSLTYASLQSEASSMPLNFCYLDSRLRGVSSR